MIFVCQNPADTRREKRRVSHDGVQRIYCQTFGGKSPHLYEIVLVYGVVFCAALYHTI